MSCKKIWHEYNNEILPLNEYTSVVLFDVVFDSNTSIWSGSLLKKFIGPENKSKKYCIYNKTQKLSLGGGKIDELRRIFAA